MSGAARALYLSQPTVSQAIGELEKHYNGLLFERLGKKLYLTDRGKLLLPHAEQLVQQFRQVEELMLNQGQSSTLKLGSTITVGTCLTPSVVVALQEHFPEMSVYSYVSNTRDIEEKLLKSELDAAVVEGEILSSDLIVLPVIDDCIYRPDRAHCTAFQCMASADTVHAFRSSVHDDYSGIGIPASVNRASSSSTLSRK